MTEAASAPLQVLTVTTFFPNAGDPQRAVFVYNLVCALQRHCAVTVIAPVPYAPPLARRPRWRQWRAVAARETIGGVTVQHPRVLVVPGVAWLSGLGYSLGIFASLRRAARAAAVGRRVIVHVHCAYPDAVGVALACRLLRLPYVVTAHGSDINVYAHQAKLRVQIGWALRRASGVIAVSQALAHEVAALGGTAPSCIACAAFDPRIFGRAEPGAARTTLGLALHGRMALFVGQLVAVKGLDTLIAAWGLLQQRGLLTVADRLVLIGTGPLLAALAAQAAAADLPVQFIGAVPQATVACWMQAASVLCLPSRHEGTPNVIVEAMACGLPVVASRVGGIPALVQDGENGCLTPSGDAPALADALATALARQWDSAAIAATVAERTWTAIAAKNFAFLDTRAG
jgi:teichuronic acid biosynthesis glycosyltransferase TuaC